MKKILICVLSITVLAITGLFAGCSSLPSHQQQFVQACSVVNGELTVLAASPLLTPAQAAVVNSALAKNQLLCSTVASVNVSELRDFHDSLLPAVIKIVEAFPTLPNQPQVLFALQAFGPLVQGLVDNVLVTQAAVK